MDVSAETFSPHTNESAAAMHEMEMKRGKVARVLQFMQRRFIPEGRRGSSYEQKIGVLYREMMEQKAAGLLFKMETDSLDAVIAYFENEAAIREMLSEYDRVMQRLGRLGYDEDAMAAFESVVERVLEYRLQASVRAEDRVLEEHPSLKAVVERRLQDMMRSAPGEA